MQLLATERRTLETYLSGLDVSLAKIPLQELESSSAPGIDLFRQTGGPGLLIPRRVGKLQKGLQLQRTWVQHFSRLQDFKDARYLADGKQIMRFVQEFAHLYLLRLFFYLLCDYML